MYILFEKFSSNADNSLYSYDCMGFTDNEEDAMKWRDNNPEYRAYKYCPNTKINF